MLIDLPLPTITPVILLSLDNLKQIPVKPGVYVLWHDDKVVYIGKSRSLRTRLKDHAKKCVGLEAYARCAVMSYWVAVGVEQALIDTHHPAWNGSGFGRRKYEHGRKDITTAWDGIVRASAV